MTKLDSYGEYVRRRLDDWGFEYALHRDFEYLGHCSKNMLQVLIDHKGEIPPPNVGYKPLEVDLLCQQIEDIVADIARDDMRTACILRAYFCASGRRKVERYETALMLIANVERVDGQPLPKLPNLRAYMAQVEIGVAQVRGALRGIALAA